MMTDCVYRAIKKWNMDFCNRRVLVCVSGGADSMALLHFFWKNRTELGYKTLEAMHFNHGLRGEESDRDEKTVRDFCSMLGVTLHVEYGKMLESGKGADENTARKLRYEFFESIADEDDLIVTGHTLSDHAETVLFRIARGTGLRGLRGIPALNGRIRRPLLLTPGDQTVQYCLDNQIPFQTDSTNCSEIYARNRIRAHAVPALKSVNSGFEQNVLALSTLAADSWDYFMRKAKALLDESAVLSGYSCENFLKEDPVIRGYAVKYLLDEVVSDITEAQVLACMDLIGGGSRILMLTDRVRMRRSHGVFFLEEVRPHPPLQPQEIVLGNCVRLPDMTLDVRLESPFSNAEELNSECSQKIYINLLDYDKIKGKVILRSPKTGDRFAPAGRGLSKTLKKWFNENSVSPESRPAWPILEDANGIVWVYGGGPDERVKIGADTKSALVLRIKTKIGDF